MPDHIRREREMCAPQGEAVPPHRKRGEGGRDACVVGERSCPAIPIVLERGRQGEQ